MKKLAVYFPGIGYTVDKPLMHYSRRLAAGLGYEVLLLPYSGFPPKILGDPGKMLASFRIAQEQAEKMLAEIDLTDYDDILFIGKSIGTVVAAKIASESPARSRIRLVLYTPLEETFSFSFGKAVAFTGTDDPWVGREKSRIAGLCKERNIPCHQIPGGNHSLETPDLQEDIKSLERVMKETELFLRSM
ncbi:MAG: alpha/beta hydrolase [Eubacteriales bacterium]|nr:alpha/beta hydrolase [Eubacteriales bacterium]